MESKYFRMNGGRFLREMIFRYGGIWLGSLSMVAVIGLIFGIVVDIRWLIVALMVVFIIIPMGASFIYYYYGLRKEFYINTVLHSVAVGDDALMVRMRFPISDAEDEKIPNDSEESSEEIETCKKREIEWKEREVSFEYKDLKPYVIGHDSAIIPIKSSAGGFIWLPLTAYESAEEMKEVLEYLDKKILV